MTETMRVPAINQGVTFQVDALANCPETDALLMAIANWLWKHAAAELDCEEVLVTLVVAPTPEEARQGPRTSVG
jgi:hypothetical protein